MAILVDDPIWPAHGRLWAHLVSDSDVDELHAFAAAHEIPPRAFDLDHYDVPEDALPGSSPAVRSTSAARSSPAVSSPRGCAYRLATADRRAPLHSPKDRRSPTVVATIGTSCDDQHRIPQDPCADRHTVCRSRHASSDDACGSQACSPLGAASVVCTTAVPAESAAVVTRRRLRP